MSIAKTSLTALTILVSGAGGVAHAATNAPEMQYGKATSLELSALQSSTDINLPEFDLDNGASLLAASDHDDTLLEHHHHANAFTSNNGIAGSEFDA